MELQFHPGPARKLATNLYDLYQASATYGTRATWNDFQWHAE